jgi:hypothetical protein
MPHMMTADLGGGRRGLLCLRIGDVLHVVKFSRGAD